MRIKYVEIKNFRSIENVKLDFNENPRVLVGITEAGKTNILHALRLLSDEYKIEPYDIRQPTKGIVDEAYICFVFVLEDNEIKEIFEELKKEILINDIQKKFIKVKNKNLSLFELLQTNNEGIYEIDIKNNTRYSSYFEFDGMDLLCDFRKPRIGTNFEITDKNGNKLNISSVKIICYDDFKEAIPENYLEKPDSEELENIIGSKIKEIVNKNLPKIIFWEYSDANLLPPSISIDTFQNNPNSCIPLKNLFLIAGIPEDKISQSIREVRRNFNDFQSLLNRVADAGTKFFRKAWPEYKDIKFNLHLTETFIRCGVEEKNIYDFTRRSDGFKKFVSLLLVLSIPAKKRLLENSLILIDDADTNLHPSGSRYLMEQLKKIAQTNYVIYATHSIFMIDRDNIQRHYIVKKEKEVTKIIEANEENYRDEEVLYKALGASLYEILDERNILFEGWTDKKLFEVYISKHENLKKFFKNIGISHGEGVKTKELTATVIILEMAKRKILIISDGDEPAKEKQKKFEEGKLYGKWKRYDEILEERKVVTAEDFIKKEILKERLENLLKKYSIQIDQEIDIPDNDRLQCIKNFIQEYCSQQNIGNYIKEFKNDIFNNLKYEWIEPDYEKFVKNLQKEIENL